MAKRLGTRRLSFVLTATLSSLLLAVACGSSSDEPKGSAGSGGDNLIGGGGASGKAGASGKGGSSGELKTPNGEAGSSGAQNPVGGEGGDAGASATRLSVAPATLLGGRVGKAYSATLTLSGASGVLTWTSIGALPPGIALVWDRSENATLQGTPTAAGVYSFGVQVKTAQGDVLIKYALHIRALPWLLFTSPTGASAVDLSVGSPGAPYVFSRALVGAETLSLYAEQPGGSQYLFRIDDTVNSSGWVTSFAGLTPTQGVRVSTPQGNYSRAQGFAWSADGTRLAWSANLVDFGPDHLYVADMSGPAPGAPFEVNSTLPSGGSASNPTWGGSRLFFSVSGPTAGPDNGSATQQVTAEIATLPPAAPVALTDWGAETGAATADGSRYVYWERVTDSVGELRVIGVGGAKPTQAVRLHPALTDTQSAGYGATLSSDGASAFFAIDNYAGAGTSRIFRTRLGAAGPLAAEPLSADMTYGDGLKLSPNGQRVLFTQGTKQLSADTGIYVVDVSTATPSAAVKISGPFVAGGTLFPPLQQANTQWSPDSQYVAYIADALQKGRREAFIVDIVHAPGNPKRLNTSLPSASSAVTHLEFSPDGTWVALLGDLDTAGVNEIFLVPLGPDGPGLPHKVGDPLAANELYNSSFVWAPDSSFFGYIVYSTSTKKSRGSVVPLATGSVGTSLPIGGTGQVTSMRFLAAGY